MAQVAVDDRAPAVAVDVDLATLIRERQVMPVLQPIVDLATGAVVGVEALARGPAGTALERPDQLFAAATRAGLLAPLDMLCAERGLEAALEMPLTPPLVFINAEPAALNQPLSPRLMRLLLGGLPFRVITEFTERALSAVPAALLGIAGQSHELGNGIALDDVGADPMSLAFLPFVDPDVIKLDMNLLRNPDAASTAEVCAVVAATARRTGAKIIAEGIETAEDVVTARALGADWGQGWHFGRPARPADLRFSALATSTGLRSPRAGLHRPVGSPYEVAESGGAHVIDEASARRDLERVAAAVDGRQHAVALGSYCSPDELAKWQPQADQVSRQALYTAVLAPDGPSTPFPGESCLIVMTPHHSVALCHRTGVGVLRTEDPELVASIGRVVLQRLDSVSLPAL
ncbi:EAL domain-containing protein [Actinoplanes sp. HUAS TT8]|uniref:EAL domain-containing protein n=1 Tax=Actinoplanes sp. HUAS TT8 TaxID=3447453 RepID=UPI003F51EC17